MSRHKTQLLILGAGPGGYVAAIRAGRLGIKTTLIEEDKVGGVCLNYGCIPTKALLSKTALLSEIKKGKRFGLKVEGLSFDYSKLIKYKNQVVSGTVKGVESLLNDAGVAVIRERGNFIDEHSIELSSGDICDFEHAIIATGSRNRNLSHIAVDNREILDSTGLLELTEIPERLLVIGAGAIGLELGLIFNRLGSKVTVVEMMPEILPDMDKGLAKMLRKALFREGMKFHTGATVDSLKKVNGGLEAEISGESKPLSVDKALLAVGRTPNIEAVNSLELESMPNNFFIKVDGSMRTSLPHIRAIGDVTGPPLLAHRASHQGMTAVESINGKPDNIEPFSPVPGAVFTEPEFASVGLTAEKAISQGWKAVEHEFPLRGLGRAKAMGANEGAFKIVSDAEGKILGVHILAPAAGDLIAEASLAIKMGMTIGQVAEVIHAHPTLSEGLLEAALLAGGKRIHI